MDVEKSRGGREKKERGRREVGRKEETSGQIRRTRKETVG